MKHYYNLIMHRILVNGWSIERVIRDVVDSCQTMHILYKTTSGEWTENSKKAFWYHWNHKTDGNLCADTKYEYTWDILGTSFKNREEAIEALTLKILMPAFIVGIDNIAQS